ncbi:ParA family protein (plasmid) [Kosakonia radicincitans]|uniref:ParA family protein n=1 Tax=Kosakonia radicincitans TaxID=283686 RepID=UPI0011EEF793|nr:ParA family protein [Kosakonia radicincitans]QEM94357.1 ParA family protein [Kosakonia radicincitans]
MAVKTPDKSRATIFAVMNNKGGAGKTSTATNLAVAMAQSGRKGLLIDSDQQANATEVLAHGRKFYAQFGHTICDLYANARFDIREAIIPARAGDTDIPNLDFLPADPTFEKTLEQTLTRSHREKILYRHLQTVIGDYDFIIIDCSPGLNLATGNAIYVADHVLVPIDGGSFALSALEVMLDFMDEINEGEYTRFSVFRNEYNRSNKVINKFIEDQLEQHPRLKGRVLESSIRADQTIVQSQVACIPLYYYAKGSLALNDYRKLARELEEKTQKEVA